MKLPGRTEHLTYCTNIHPGESWDEVFRNIETHVLEVKRQLSPAQPFGVGLRLSAEAAEALSEPDTLASFRRYLADHQLYVFTLNGFPYGRFHGQPVKEQVYSPDWLEDARLTYTDRLASILAALLPHDMGPLQGSVSTVPGGFRARAEGQPDIEIDMARRLVRHVGTLVRLAAEGGPTIGLALEPEPFCLWETTAELVSFFERRLFTDQACSWLAELTGRPSSNCSTWLRRHLGMCLDACHAAVEFEDVDSLASLLQQSGVRVLKMQVTTGLRVTRPAAETLDVLQRFADDVYLHQSVVRRGHRLDHYRDLPEALSAASAAADCGDEWRVHFHVPVFQADLSSVGAGFENTHAFLGELLRLQAAAPLTEHLEVETYTWDVLPQTLRSGSVEEAILRELRWTMGQLDATG